MHLLLLKERFVLDHGGIGLGFGVYGDIVDVTSHYPLSSIQANVQDSAMRHKGSATSLGPGRILQVYMARMCVQRAPVHNSTWDVTVYHEFDVWHIRIVPFQLSSFRSISNEGQPGILREDLHDSSDCFQILLCSQMQR